MEAGERSAELFLEHGHVLVQGRRPYMEDRVLSHVTRLGLTGPQVGIFAVCDGHGGSMVSDYLTEHLLDSLMRRDVFGGDAQAALTESCRELEAEVLQMSKQERTYAGSTLNCAVLTGGRVICCNVGDSRAVMCRNGEAVQLSYDHSPLRPSEVKRVRAAGGFVDNGGVNGLIQVTRAIGDLDLKAHKEITFPGTRFFADLVTAEPEFVEHDIRSDDEFIILASDGLWCKVGNEEAVKLVKRQLEGNTSPSKAAHKLAMSAYNAGSTDNIAVLVVLLQEPARMSQSTSLHAGARLRSLIARNYSDVNVQRATRTRATQPILGMSSSNLKAAELDTPPSDNSHPSSSRSTRGLRSVLQKLKIVPPEEDGRPPDKSFDESIDEHNSGDGANQPPGGVRLHTHL